MGTTDGLGAGLTQCLTLEFVQEQGASVLCNEGRLYAIFSHDYDRTIRR